MGSDILKRRQFGSAPLMVPPIAVGCAPMGNMVDTFLYAVSEEEAVATIKAAMDSPIDYIDTAALYGNGESERRVGLALKELGGLAYLARLTADGQLRNCLFSTTEYDLLPVLRGPAPGDDAIDRMLRSCVHGKLPGHAINDPSFLQPARGMNAIGG